MTAPLTPERLAEVRRWVHEGGPIGARPLMTDLLAEVERLTERAERAEGALARVETLAAAFESPGVGYRGVAIAIREAMEGKP